MLQAEMEPGPGMRKTDHSRDQERDVLASDEVVDDAVSQVVAGMYGIEANSTDQTPPGPIPTSEVEVEGLTTRALLDTGSPVSIIHLISSSKQPQPGRPPIRHRPTGEEKCASDFYLSPCHYAATAERNYLCWHESCVS